MSNPLPVAPSEALLQEIERQTLDETRAVAESAGREAQAIVAQAYAEASRRMHDTVAELRRERAGRLARARAKLETEARIRDQQRAMQAIRQAWPLVVEALDARWTDPAPRRIWVESVARQARERLRTATWRVEHPADWSAADEQHFREVVAKKIEIAFAADVSIAAGLRISAGEATLDATPQGLLNDCAGITALLLAEIAGGTR